MAILDTELPRIFEYDSLASQDKWKEEREKICCLWSYVHLACPRGKYDNNTELTQ